jgi:hypothetical protein
MTSDIDKFFSVLAHLLRDAHNGLGEAAPLVVCIFMLAGILAGVLSLRWILRGGLSRSSQHLPAGSREPAQFQERH